MSHDAPRRLVRAEAILARRQRQFTVVLEDTHDPHNLSAVLRTCEAFGVQDVHLVIECNESPAINRDISLGAHQWLTLHRHYGSAKAIDALRRSGYRIYAALVRPDAVPLPQVDRDTKAAFVFGNESSGLTEQWAEAADACIAIPTCGFTGSLNLSVAVAVTLYDRLMGTARSELPEGSLEQNERRELRALWYEKLAHGSDVVLERYREYLDDPPQPETIFPVDTHGSPRS
jgi:tRNA (guanosine-2'-O-)-methyltransferase